MPPAAPSLRPYSPHVTLDVPNAPLLTRVAAAVAAAAPDPDAVGAAALQAIVAGTRARGAVVTSEACGVLGVRWSAGDVSAADGSAAYRIDVPLGAQGGRLELALGRPDPMVDEGELRAALALVAAVVAPADRARALGAEVETHARAAAAERDFAAAVLDALPLGVYVTDQEHRVRLWNRKREVGTLGVPREEAIGRTVFDVLPRQDAALVRGELEHVLATGAVQRLDTEGTDPAGGAPGEARAEARTYRLTKIPMTLGAGAPTHVITVGEDVTEWRAALDRSAQAEKLAAVGQLAAGVMHEINNPLATIAACAETMTLGLAELPAEARPLGFGEYLRIVDHEIHRCRRIVDGLLNFSRAREPRRTRVALDAVVEQTLEILRHHARFKRCALRLDLGGEAALPEVLGDPDQLVQIAMALLLNAADAVEAADRADEAGGEEGDGRRRGVTVRTRAGVLDEGDQRPAAVLEIADDGTGMTRETVARIFDPFFTTKAPGEGTGLGLAICYGLVRDLDGRIDVESTPGEGTTFRVTIPGA